MIGRGSIINPFIFHEIQGHYSGIPFRPQWDDMIDYINSFVDALPPGMPIKTQVNKLKQLMGFIFKGNALLQESRNTILTSQHPDPHSFVAFVLPHLKKGWSKRR